MSNGERNTIFISHANPADNIFSIWLAARLSALGYQIWCDVEQLIAGEDHWKDIEQVIRSKAVRFILVISSNAFADDFSLRDGIAKEVALADVVKKQLQDNKFVIPVRLDETPFSDVSVETIRLNTVDCSQNWAQGFQKIVKALERDQVPRDVSENQAALSEWSTIHRIQSREINAQKERLQSNWLPILELPEQVHFYKCRASRWPKQPRLIASDCVLPCSDHHKLLVSFAETEELQKALGDSIPIAHRGSLRVENFLRNRMGDIVGIEPRDARNKLTSMIRQAWDLHMQSNGLEPYVMANGVTAWWFPKSDQLPEKLEYVDFDGRKRTRVPFGTHGKIKQHDETTVPRHYWHLGFSARVQLGDNQHIALQPRVIVTTDGRSPLSNKTRLNAARRSITKMWFNEKWRTLSLAYAHWLADDAGVIRLPVGEREAIPIEATPVMFDSEFSIVADPVKESLAEAESDQLQRDEATFRVTDPAFIDLVSDEEGGA